MKNHGHKGGKPLKMADLLLKIGILDRQGMDSDELMALRLNTKNEEHILI